MNNLVRTILGKFFNLFLAVKVFGDEQPQASDAPCMVIINHVSEIDILIYASISTQKLCLIILPEQELEHPFWISLCGIKVIKMENIFSIRKTPKLIKAGYHLIMQPELYPTTSGNLKRMHPIPLQICIFNKIELQTCFVSGLEYTKFGFLSRWQHRYRGTVNLGFGEKICIQPNKPQMLTDEFIKNLFVNAHLTINKSIFELIYTTISQGPDQIECCSDYLGNKLSYSEVRRLAAFIAINFNEKIPDRDIVFLVDCRVKSIAALIACLSLHKHIVFVDPRAQTTEILEIIGIRKIKYVICDDFLNSGQTAAIQQAGYTLHNLNNISKAQGGQDHLRTMVIANDLDVFSKTINENPDLTAHSLSFATYLRDKGPTIVTFNHQVIVNITQVAHHHIRLQSEDHLLNTAHLSSAQSLLFGVILPLTAGRPFSMSQPHNKHMQQLIDRYQPSVIVTQDLDNVPYSESHIRNIIVLGNLTAGLPTKTNLKTTYVLGTPEYPYLARYTQDKEFNLVTQAKLTKIAQGTDKSPVSLTNISNFTVAAAYSFSTWTNKLTIDNQVKQTEPPSKYRMLTYDDSEEFSIIDLTRTAIINEDIFNLDHIECVLNALNPAHIHLCKYDEDNNTIIFISNNPGLTSKSIVNLLADEYPTLKNYIYKKMVYLETITPRYQNTYHRKALLDTAKHPNN